MSSSTTSTPASSFTTRNPLIRRATGDRLATSATAASTPSTTAAATATTALDPTQVELQQEAIAPYFPTQAEYLSHLPPPYLPLDYSIPYPTPTTSTTHADAAHPSYADSLSKLSSGPPPLHPAIMVYPPPPPPPPSANPHPNPNARQPPAHVNEDRRTLPSMGSWAPPPVLPSPRRTVPKAEYWQDRQREHEPDSSPEKDRKRARVSLSSRRPSDAEEEAGLALAGMGLGLTPTQVKARRDDIVKNKRIKVEEKPKKEAKEGKKSCSECRRLKAKCDRVFPCSNCRRRGCALVCPDGDLSCMQGKRLVLASTEQLHERIAQLESALFKAHSATHAEHHPLLAPEYLDGGFASMSTPPLQMQPSHSPPSFADAPSHSPKDRYSDSSFTLATPHLSADRASSQGRMAVESLLLTDDQAAPEGKREDDWVGENAAPALIVGSVDRAPSEERSDERHAIFERLRSILRVLPAREATRSKAERFWHTSTWYNNILRKDEFESIYEPAVYAPTPTNPITPHKLACVLMLLTLDTYFDLESDEDDPAIAEYWEGAQMCFDTRFGWASSVAGVQALALATLFVGFGWRGAKATNLYWLRQMTTAVQALGLHKDPHPSLPEEERDFRRRVFHESYCLDCLISINHGQRTGVQLENIEAAMPKHASPLSLMKYEYMRTVKAAVIDIGCRPDSAPASWELVNQTEAHLLKSDGKTVPHIHCPTLSSLPPPMTENVKQLNVLDLTKCTNSMCHYKALLYLYRPSLRRLICKLRTEPSDKINFSSEDQQTVSRTYSACHAITATSLYMARTHPRLSARCWAVWVQTFSAAVSMAALAIWCGPYLDSTFVNSAYQEIVDAGEMIKESGSKRSQGIVSLMPILRSLVSGRYPQVIGQPPDAVRISQEGEDMLFALLGGQVDQRVPAPMLAEPMPLALAHGHGHPHPHANVNVNGPVDAAPLHFSHGQPQGWGPGYDMVQPVSGMHHGDVGGYIPVPQQVQHAYPQNVPQHPQQHQPPPPPQHQPQQHAQPRQHSQQYPQHQHVQHQSQPQFQPQTQPQHQQPHQHQHQQQQSQHPHSHPHEANTNYVAETSIEDMSATELWARLQTFYEPTPASWDPSGIMISRGSGDVMPAAGGVAASGGTGAMAGGLGADGGGMWMSGVGGVMT